MPTGALIREFPIHIVPAYLRVAGLSIAIWDLGNSYVSTLRAEVRFYRRQSSLTCMSRACVLFIAIRYLSIVALSVSSIGFFGSFSPDACRRFHLVVPCMKMIAYIVSQMILGIRTYAISAKSRWVLWTLSVLFVCTLPFEIVGNVVDRVVAQNVFHNCTSGNSPGNQRAWYHYAAAIVYDIVALGIASSFLYAHSEGGSMISGLVKCLFEDGLIYFLALTASNILNVVLFRQSSLALQSAAATPGQAFTMIFSQKLLLNLSCSVRHPQSITNGFGEDFAQNCCADTRPRRRHRSLTNMFPDLDERANDTELGDIRVHKKVEINTEAFDNTHESLASAKMYNLNGTGQR